jgi:UDP-2,3-diacylglucosamine pyrophosphatase LpxH
MNKFTRYEAVALSDIHLGTRYCNYEKFDYFLNNIKTDKLFLVGDVVDVSKGDFSKYPISKYIDKLKQMSKRMEIVWICGNHEITIKNIEILTRGSNIQVVKDTYIDRKLGTIFTHGHLYSEYSSGSWRKLSKKLYNIIRPIDYYSKKFFNFSVIGYLKNTTRAKKYIHSYQESLFKYLIKIRKDNWVHAIVCGHIHTPKTIEDRENNLTYVNCGDWIDNNSFAVRDRDGWEINYV